MVNEYYGRRDAYISNLIRRKAKAICRHPGYNRQDVEDVEHDLWLHLLEHQDRFDDTRSCFETFADRVIENRVRSMLRHRRAQRRDARREKFSLDELIANGDGNTIYRHETLPTSTPPPSHAFDQREDVQTLLAQLTEPDVAVAVAILAGISKRQIRRRLQISRRQLDRAVGRVREAAQRLGLDPHFE